MTRRDGWQTSSYSLSDNCVEVRRDHRAIRDTKQRDGGSLTVPTAPLVAFARRFAAAGAALSILGAALVSSVEYAPPTGQNWKPVASSAICRCAPDAASDYR